MSQDPQQLVLAGTGNIYVAPAGTTLPADTDPTAELDPAFIELGLTTTDGATFTRTPEIQEFGSWQRRRTTRREVVSETLVAAFSLQQWNSDNFSLAFGGGTFAETDPGVFKYTPPSAAESLPEYAFVLDWRDGDKNYRVVIERGNHTEAVETTLARSDLSVLPISFSALGGEDEDDPGWFFITDDPAFETTGS